MLRETVMEQHRHAILIALAPTGVLTPIITAQRECLAGTVAGAIWDIDRLLTGPVALTTTTDAAALLPSPSGWATRTTMAIARQVLINAFHAMPVSWALVAYSEDPSARPELLAQASGTPLPHGLFAIASTTGRGVDRSAHERLADVFALQTTPHLGPAGANDGFNTVLAFHQSPDEAMNAAFAILGARGLSTDEPNEFCLGWRNALFEIDPQ
jgi:hypothetical protein